jgi:hypothetical protein
VRTIMGIAASLSLLAMTATGGRRSTCHNENCCIAGSSSHYDGRDDGAPRNDGTGLPALLLTS